MVKLIEAETMQDLENLTNNWIQDNTNDGQKMNIVSSQVIPIQSISGYGIAGQTKVKTSFVNWLVYSLAPSLQ